MGNHKIFKSAAIPIILIIVGIGHYTQNILTAVILGVIMYAIALLIDNLIGKRR